MAYMKAEEWTLPNNLKRIEGWARDGLRNEDIASRMGISPSTFYEYVKKFSEISDALKRGKAPVDFEVENAMLKSALGHKETVRKPVRLRTTRRKDGMEITEEHVEYFDEEVYIPPQVSAQIFWLKNRKPDIWRDKKELTTNTALEKLDDILKETRVYAGLEPEAEGIPEEFE